jgi:hypothetical protein
MSKCTEAPTHASDKSSKQYTKHKFKNASTMYCNEVNLC